MPEDSFVDLNEIELEAPGGTQTTHSAAAPGARDRLAESVTRVSDTLHRRALELELEGGLKAKAAPAVRRASLAADASAEYVRANDLNAMRHDLEDGIREHPLRSMAIAVGCGYLLAKLLD
jgi:ElaB/YqjD/DUF883 family membrane-anchored ribosome-binding protein